MQEEIVKISIKDDRLQMYVVKDLAKKVQALVKKESGQQSLVSLLKEQRQEDLLHELDCFIPNLDQSDIKLVIPA